MKKILFLVLIVACAGVFNQSNAQSVAFRSENREIRKGFNNGQLTRAEVKQLKRQQKALRCKAVKFKANDGKISAAERQELRRDNKRLNRNIDRQRYDKQRRRV